MNHQKIHPKTMSCNSQLNAILIKFNHCHVFSPILLIGNENYFIQFSHLFSHRVRLQRKATMITNVSGTEFVIVTQSIRRK